MHGSQYALTFVIYITLGLALLSSANANERRSHRILKKRLPQDPSTLGPLEPLVGAQSGPPTPEDTLIPTPPVEDADETPITTSTLVEETGLPAIVTTTNTTDPLVLTTTSSTTTETTSESVTSTTSSTPETPVTTEAPVPSSGPQLITSIVEGEVTTRTTAVVASATAPVPQNTGASKSGSSIVITVLIAVGASIGGIVILWTIFRKWKLSRSTKVDQRMQPIDWQPTGYNDMLPGEHRRHSGSSFHSYSHQGHNSDDGHSSQGHGRNPAASAVPSHDFTAVGSNNLAPVGGYADLARGPSPQPQMQEMGAGGFTQQGGQSNDPFNHRF